MGTCPSCTPLRRLGDRKTRTAEGCLGGTDAKARRGPAAADTQVLFQAERTLLRAYEDWIAYAVNPEIYHRQPFLQWDERELTGLCDFAGKRIVDVGSGTGKQAFAVAPLCKAVYCVEPAWSLRRYLRERAEREHVKNLYVADGLMESLPFEDGFARHHYERPRIRRLPRCGTRGNAACHKTRWDGNPYPR